MFTRFEAKGAFTAVGVQGSPLDGDETPVYRLVDDFIKVRRSEVPHAIDERTEYGIGIKPRDESEAFVYFYGRPVHQVDEVPEGMVARTFDAQNYAVFTHTGDVSDIRERTFGYIFHTWLPESEYEWNGGPFMEVYTDKYIPAGPDVAKSEIYIYMPVVPKATTSAE